MKGSNTPRFPDFLHLLIGAWNQFKQEALLIMVWSLVLIEPPLLILAFFKNLDGEGLILSVCYVAVVWPFFHVFAIRRAANFSKKRPHVGLQVMAHLGRILTIATLLALPVLLYFQITKQLPNQSWTASLPLMVLAGISLTILIISTFFFLSPIATILDSDTGWQSLGTSFRLVRRKPTYAVLAWWMFQGVTLLLPLALGGVLWQALMGTLTTTQKLFVVGLPTGILFGMLYSFTTYLHTHLFLHLSSHFGIRKVGSWKV